jgi:CDP-diacylglycerol--glycerol-3-phosphate 3-phosphatidyltransferase
VSFANQLTVARVAAVPAVIVLFAWDFPGHDYWATALFAVAMATDWLDGWWARRRDQSSDLGRLLDPVADKLLVLAVLVMLVGSVFPA